MKGASRPTPSKPPPPDYHDRMRSIFGLALHDCASIQRLIALDRETPGHVNTKEAYIVTTIANACADLRQKIPSWSGEASIALPRHPAGGETSEIKSMSCKVTVPSFIGCKGFISPPYHRGSECPPLPSTPKATSVLDQLYEAVLIQDAGGTPDHIPDFQPNDEEEDEESDDDAPLWEVRPQEDNIHIFADPHPRPDVDYVALPVICIGDRERTPELLVAMAAALWHRSTWLSKAPVIGLLFDRYKPFISLIIGWLDSDIPDGACLPKVHIGRSATGSGWNFADPESLLKFYNFCGFLEDHFVTVCMCTRTKVLSSPEDIVSWRLDTINIPDAQEQANVTESMQSGDGDKADPTTSSSSAASQQL